MSRTKDRRGRKAVALAAVAAVLGAGVYTTLASWNDTEWVFAGLSGDGDGTPDLGTSTFNVQQNRDQAPDASATFGDHSSNLDAGALQFTADVTLSPGTTKYAPVALRTTSDSLAGDVTLQAPVAAEAVSATDPDGLLWGALTYSVRTTATATACDSSTWETFGSVVATDVPFTGALIAPTQSLAAGSGSVQYYCFAVTLPEAPALPAGRTVDELQGRAVHPAWNFASESVG